MAVAAAVHARTPMHPVASYHLPALQAGSVQLRQRHQALLTVMTLNEDNNPVAQRAGDAVSVNTGVYTPISSRDRQHRPSLAAASTIGGNKANRNITATISPQQFQTKHRPPSRSVGSAITLTPLPATPAPGDFRPSRLSRLEDATGTGVASIVNSHACAGTGSASPASSRTDFTGLASATRSAPGPPVPSTYIIEAAALGRGRLQGLGAGDQLQRQLVRHRGGGRARQRAQLRDQCPIRRSHRIPIQARPPRTAHGLSRQVPRPPPTQAIQNMRVRFEIVAHRRSGPGEFSSAPASATGLFRQ